MASVEFDPYQKWLGIPPAEQPPNYYRLLNLPAGEADTAKIAAVLKRLTAYLEARSKGQNAAYAQRLLDEVAAAQACLLDEQAKADYDAALLGTAHAANGHGDIAFADVVEADVLPNPKPARPVANEAPAQPAPAAADHGGDFFDGMDLYAAPSTPKPVAAKTTVKPAAGKKTATQAASKAGVAKGKAKPTAKGAKPGQFKFETWHMYALAGGGLLVVLIAVIIIASNSGEKPKPKPEVAKEEPRSRFVPAKFDAVESAKEIAARKRIPYGKALVEAPMAQEGNFFFTDVTIVGKPAGRFLIDTGSRYTVLDQALADKLGLKPARKAHIETLGGKQEVTFRTAASLKIQDAHWEDVDTATIDLAGWQKEVGAQFSGVLGRDIFYQTMFSIDPSNRKLIFMDRDNSRVAMSSTAAFLSNVDERPCLEVKVDGGPEKLYLLATGCSQALMTTDGGAVGGDGEPVGVATILNHEHRNLKQTVAPADGAYATGDPRQHGVVGAPILSRYMMVIDLARNKIALQPLKK